MESNGRETPQNNKDQGIQAFYEINSETLPRGYDNPGFTSGSRPGSGARYPIYFTDEHLNEYNSLKREVQRYSLQEKKDKNNRNTAVIVVVVLAVILILGAAGAVIGVVLTRDNTSDDAKTVTTNAPTTAPYSQDYPGEATLRDLMFTDGLRDPTSLIYRQTERDFIEKMDQRFAQSALSSTYNKTTVHGFRSGSVIVLFSVSFTSNIEVGSEPSQPIVNLNTVRSIVRQVDIVENVDVAQVSLCASNPCRNGATCEGGVSTYNCRCAPGYSGIFCETEINVCESNPCENGASCTDNSGTYSCSCQDGYTGNRCEIEIDPCQPNRCENGASCVEDGLSFICNCMVGYTGDLCQTEILECSSNPCKNGADCVEDIGSYFCTCQAGFTGLHCQTNINECGTTPCLNGGSCTDDVNSYMCTCLDGFMGENCEIDIDECQNNPCRNGASCEDGVNSYHCTCAHGYAGKICQTDINECDSGPCLNGATCTNTEGSYSCSCMTGYTGVHCENMTGSSSTISTVTSPSSTTTPPSTIPPTIQPITNIICKSGYENVEVWVRMSYSYTERLQDKTSAEYSELSAFVDTLIMMLFPPNGPVYQNVELVAFQRLNGSTLTVATIQACVSSMLMDIKILYGTLVYIDPSELGIYVIGLQMAEDTSSKRPVNFTCPSSYHDCSGEDRCIPESFKCDNMSDCANGEDEAAVTCGMNMTTTHSPSVTSPGYNTTTGTPSSSSPPFTDTTTFMTTTPEPCNDDEYQCYTTNECFNKSIVCDGIKDCKDNSDEWYCPTTPIPRPTALEVRLMDGYMDTTSQLYGRVEVRPVGTDAPFGTICGDMWGVEEALVVCKQLGYQSSSNVYAYNDARYGEGEGPIYLGKMRCSGNEADLMECESFDDWGYIHCGHNQDAAVSCGFEATTKSSISTTTAVMPTAAYTNIRLYGGENCLEGKLEVLFNGQWGTVCDDFFDKHAADIVCRQLGLEGAVEFGYYLFETSNTDKPINMDDVKCNGNESTIFECDYIVQHNCAHFEDVGIICSGVPEVVCYEGPVPETVNCDFNLHNCQYTTESVTGNASWYQGNVDFLHGNGAYMYLRNKVGKARLTSPVFDGSSQPHKVEFMYNVLRSHYNNLALMLHKSTDTPEMSTEHKLWNSQYLRSDEDGQWIYQCVDLPVSEDKKYNLVFEGLTDTDVIVGVDSINVTEGDCKSSLLNGPCTLDNPNKCGMIIECTPPCRRDVPTFRWYWSDKGPNHYSDKHIQVDSVFGNEGDTAVVHFKLPYIMKGWNVKYRGHMSGKDTGMLQISLLINNTAFVLDTLKGKQQDGWFDSCLKLPSVTLRDNYDLNLQFEVTRGSGPHGDVYMDDVELVESCMDKDIAFVSMWNVTNRTSDYRWMYKGKAEIPIVRFVNPESPDEGWIEYYDDGEYKGLCVTDDFSYNTADAFCRTFGYKFGIFSRHTRNITFWENNFNCSDEAESIEDCEIFPWSNTTNCTEDEHAYIYCYSKMEGIEKSYFTQNFFYLADNNNATGEWTTLMTNTVVISDQMSPMKLMFDVHKLSSDILKVHALDQSTNMTSVIATMTDQFEFASVCLDLPEGHWHLGLTAIKDDLNVKSKVEVKNVEFKHGHCKGPIGREPCDFQSEFTGCSYEITSNDGTCGKSYMWRHVPVVGDMYDYTYKNHMGYFMYIDNKLGTTGDISTLQLNTLDIVQDGVPFVCSLRFAYFVSDGSLTVVIDGRSEQITSVSVNSHMWRQGCLMIKPGTSCPVSSGTVDISFVASGVEAGIDDVHISAEPCLPADNITCEFDFGDDCGYSWTNNLTSIDGAIMTTADHDNFTIISPTFTTTTTDICLTVENKNMIDYNLSMTVYNMQGDVVNFTYYYPTAYDNIYVPDIFLSLHVQTIPGDSYVLFIEGTYYPTKFYFHKNVSIDNVRMFSGHCSNVVFPCRDSEISCLDGTCVSKLSVCDGKRDCSNSMDEQMCECDLDQSPHGVFSCNDTGCIHPGVHCDGIQDCEDGSDEICESSLSCEFEDPFICGYSLYNAHHDLYTNNVKIFAHFGYMESPVVTIATESCFTIHYSVEMVNYVNQSSLRLLSNTMDTLDVLSYIDIMGHNHDAQLTSSSIELPTGTYSVILEAQGLYVDVSQVSMETGTCPEIATTPLPMTSKYPSSVSSMMMTSTMTSIMTTHTPLHTTTEMVIPDDFPTVTAVSDTVESFYAESVELSCMVNTSPEYQGTLFWFSDHDQMIARDNDIMLEDENQTKYSVIRYPVLDTIMYTLTIHDVEPVDTNRKYRCTMMVHGYPTESQQSAFVHVNTPAPTEDACLPNPFSMCKESGYSSYKLPSVTGIRNHTVLHDRMSEIMNSHDSIIEGTCQSLLMELSCGLHTPLCNSQRETVHVCREHCEDIARTCNHSLPSIVLDDNVDHFCKFLPYSSDGTCQRINFECGSHIDVSSNMFRFRSEGFPSVPSDSMCLYRVFSTAMDNYFKRLEITVESLALDQQCDQSNLMIGDEILCFNSDLSQVITVQNNSVDIALTAGVTGAFLMSGKFVYPSDLCEIYMVPENMTLIEATPDSQCNRWIIMLHPAYHVDHYLQLDLISIDNGCIQLDNHTGSIRQQVCDVGTIDLMTKNITVLRDSSAVTFKLNYTAVFITEEEEIDPDLVVTHVELVGGDRPGTGFAQMYRADGVHGIVCRMDFQAMFMLCQAAGYLPSLNDLDIVTSLPEGYAPVASRMVCKDVTTDNVTDCGIQWLDKCTYCECINYVYFDCALPDPGNVSCSSDLNNCGYNITDNAMTKSLVSPTFSYPETSSIKFKVSLRGVIGDSIRVRLHDGDDVEDLWNPTSFPFNLLTGEYKMCVPLPVSKTNTDVKLEFELMFGQMMSKYDDMFDITDVELDTESCPGSFPDSVCQFDHLGSCQKLIEALCPQNVVSSNVWKIMEEKLIGDAKYGNMDEMYTYSVPMPVVTTPTRKYLRFHFSNNGSQYYQNQLNFTVSHTADSSTRVPLLEDHGTIGMMFSRCLQLDLVPFTANYVQFELVTNQSLGYVVIDDITLDDVMCPHSMSCDFESQCDITINMPNSTEAVLHWNITASADVGGNDHTLKQTSKGHMISLIDNVTIPGGEEAWFSLDATMIDSHYQCLSFYYQTYHTSSPEVSVPFVTVMMNYSSGTQNTVKMYTVAEYKEHSAWTEGRVPVHPDLGENVTFTFMARKLYDDSQIWVHIDDIMLEATTCNYGLENMEMCTFDEPMKCMYTANSTVGSGYLWDVYSHKDRTDENKMESYLQVESAYGEEGAQSYVWFEVDLSTETPSQSYQFSYMSEGTAGTLQTFVEERGSNMGPVTNVPLPGAGIWYQSDCHSLPVSFYGYVYFLATRGQGHEGKMAIDDVQIKTSCQDPSIPCDFRVQSCGYTNDGGWIQSGSGISSAIEGAELSVPLNKLEYETACLSFEVQLAEELSVLEVHLVVDSKIDVFRFGSESGTSFTGQITVVKAETHSVKFMPGSYRGVTITDVQVAQGSCSNPSCESNEFVCEEKCIKQENACDTVQDCFTGVDEDMCGFSLACEFTNGGLCDYTDISDRVNAWTLQNSHIYTDDDGNTQPLVSGNGFVITTFPEYILAHSRLQSKMTHIQTDSCLVVKYVGVTETLDMKITHGNGTVMHWMDSAVKGDNLQWKTGMIDISQGHVTVELETNMAVKGEGIPFLMKDSFLAIDQLELLEGKCEDTEHPGCQSGFELCADKSVCYRESMFCNGVIQCQDGSDETLDRCLTENSLECDFEDPDMCSYLNTADMSTNHQWAREKAFRFEVPRIDHTYGNGSGHFLYHTDLYNFFGIAFNATMESLTVQYSTDSCITFWYFLNSTKWQPNSLSAQLYVSVVYQDGVGMAHNLLWYDSADRYLDHWIQGGVPVQGNRPLKLQLMAKTFTPVEVWPGIVAVDDIQVITGNCPITQVCRPNSFECTSPKVCIPKDFLCDGTVHCSDGSDESSCNKPDGQFDVIGGDGSYGQARVFKDSAWRPVCSPVDETEMHRLAQIMCRHLGFIGLSEGFAYTNPDTNQLSASLNCTTENHCEVTIDTESCYDTRLGIKCSDAVCFAGEQLCPGTKLQCIAAGRFCDGHFDCNGGTDEMNCANCSSNEFECLNHVCIPIAERCNGVSMCTDGTDEYRCVQVDEEAMPAVTVWDRRSLSRKPVCIDSVNRTTAERLCRLSGSGHLDVSHLGITAGRQKVKDGIVIHASVDPAAGTLMPGLDILSPSQECYPLELDCYLPECGSTVFKENTMEQFIFHGEKAVLGEWPWYCQVYHEDIFLCGCSYIGDNFILTAAHCVIGYPYTPLKVWLGTIDLTLGEYGQEITASYEIRHPDYIGFEAYPLLSDIAILELPTEPIIDNFTRPVCLGELDDFDYIKSLGDAAECYVVGMGYTEQREVVGTAEDTPPLLEARVRLIDSKLCNDTWGELNEKIYDDSICVQNFAPHGPVCNGDSGGPLMCKDPRDGRWLQFGVTAFGKAGCYSHEVPDAYTSVPMFIDWIREVTGKQFNKP